MPDPCSEGAFRCNQAALERCEAGAWEPRHHCATPALCDPSGRCKEPTCESDAYNCNGQLSRTCLPGGDGWKELATCDPGEQCTIYPHHGADTPTCEPI